MEFTEDYPQKPPTVKFNKIDGQPLFHPNVYMHGGVCLSIVNPEGSTHAYGKGGTWQPSLTVRHVLCALQIFIDEPESRAAGRDEEEYALRRRRKQARRAPANPDASRVRARSRFASVARCCRCRRRHHRRPHTLTRCCTPPRAARPSMQPPLPHQQARV